MAVSISVCEYEPHEAEKVIQCLIWTEPCVWNTAKETFWGPVSLLIKQESWASAGTEAGPSMPANVADIAGPLWVFPLSQNQE